MALPSRLHDRVPLHQHSTKGARDEMLNLPGHLSIQRMQSIPPTKHLKAPSLPPEVC